MGTPEVLQKLFDKIDALVDKVAQTNLLLAEQNTKIAVMDERKADKSYVDEKISSCSSTHLKKPSIPPAALSPKQKQLLINAIVGLGTAAAAYLTAKFGI